PALTSQENSFMLKLLGTKGRFCDGLTRRSFPRIGGLAMGGLSLPTLLRAEKAAGIRKSHKSIMMGYPSGGLAHQDSFDLKPSAPAAEHVENVLPRVAEPRSNHEANRSGRCPDRLVVRGLARGGRRQANGRGAVARQGSG